MLGMWCPESKEKASLCNGPSMDHQWTINGPSMDHQWTINIVVLVDWLTRPPTVNYGSDVACQTKTFKASMHPDMVV